MRLEKLIVCGILLLSVIILAAMCGKYISFNEPTLISKGQEDKSRVIELMRVIEVYPDSIEVIDFYGDSWSLTALDGGVPMPKKDDRLLVKITRQVDAMGREVVIDSIIVHVITKEVYDRS